MKEKRINTKLLTDKYKTIKRKGKNGRTYNLAPLFLRDNQTKEIVNVQTL